MKTRIIFILSILVFSFKSFSQIDSIGHLVDAYISEKLDQYKIPGAALAVIKNNAIIKKSTYGFSNLDNQVPVSNETIFPIASIDKQITATCIMMLYEQDKLKLSDSISMFFDSVPIGWNKIQIKHLLSHTSGFPDEVPEYFNDRYLINYSTNELFQNIKKQELQFKAGESCLYSDANFFLLQLIVEKVSGTKYGEFLKKNILDPLGMYSTNTLTPKKVTPGRATSYYKNDDGEIIINTWRIVDFGPLYNDIGTTLSDLTKYDIAINTNKLLKADTYKMMWSPFIINNGTQISRFVHGKTLYWADASYGYGWFVQKSRNHRIIYHGGWTGTSITKLPDDGITIILFTNLTGGFDPDVIARHVAAFYVPESSLIGMAVQKDPHPANSLLIKDQINKIGNGVIDQTMFTNSFGKALGNTSPGFVKSLKKMGTLKSLEYLGEEKGTGNQIKAFYKATYTAGYLFYQITLTKDNKIDYISVEK